MSSFIKPPYLCIDNFFGAHQYGYVLMTKEEQEHFNSSKSPSVWTLLDFKTLEGRGGSREVLHDIPKQ